MDLRKSTDGGSKPDSQRASLEILNRVLARSASLEDLVQIDFLPCCFTESDSSSNGSASDIFQSASDARKTVDQRMAADTWTVYMLAAVQTLNLFFIYAWLAASGDRNQYILMAEVLLSFTPLSGIIGAYFKNRLMLETFHMTSMLLYCSPLFFAMAMLDVENLNLAGYGFFIYQIGLLFFQYKALRVLMQLRRDIKLRMLMQSSIISA